MHAYYMYGSTTVKDSSHVLFEMLKYTVSCANTYFRLLHYGGMHLDASTSLQAATACEEMTALWIKLIMSPSQYELSTVKFADWIHPIGLEVQADDSLEIVLDQTQAPHAASFWVAWPNLD